MATMEYATMLLSRYRSLSVYRLYFGAAYCRWLGGYLALYRVGVIN